MYHPVKDNGEAVTRQEEESIRLWVREASLRIGNTRYWFV